LIARGNSGRRIALCVFGLVGVLEVHHIIETAIVRLYTPDTVTAIPYMIFGLLLPRAVVEQKAD